MPDRAPYRFAKNLPEEVAEIVESIIDTDAPTQSTVETPSPIESQDPKEDEPRKQIKKGKCGENRCEDCDGCRRQEDCKECINCKDKRGYGGPGVLRQCCKLKKCVITSKTKVAKQKTKLSAAPLATNL